MKNIKKVLNKIEQAKNIKILYPCKRGSGAWGFTSPDNMLCFTSVPGCSVPEMHG